MQTIVQLLGRLWPHIALNRRWQLKGLLLLMLLASFAEIFSIGAVLPFLAVLTAPERVFGYPAIQPVIETLGLTEPSQLLLPVTILFGAATLIAGAMRLLLLWGNIRLSYATGADLSISIYRRTLYQPYATHCARNSSEIINGISNKTNVVIYIIMMSLTLISSCATLIAITLALFFVDPLIALAAFGGFGLIYSIIICLTRKKLSINSECVARESTQVIKSLQEGLGGIRDVLIDGSQSTYVNIYRNSDLPLRQAQASSVFISGSPRYVMETIGMILITGLAYGLVQEDSGISRVIPVLGTFALGAQRLLPVLQQAYGAWSGIWSGKVSLQDALELLDQPLPDDIKQSVLYSLSFKRSIDLKKIAFRYSSEGPCVINQLSLSIKKGSRVGFIGVTGSGKSTLLDIVMGLLQATEGTLEVDGQIISLANQHAWQTHIAHVPQAIFLADNTIEENIAFGVPKDQIDSQRVRQAARQAYIAESIESWPKQYETFVGERGVRLSGGQRQRIGIARALYKQADVIIFDEATSALDTTTEQSVMQAIEGLNKDLTVLIIAHRLTTLKNCTQIVEIGEGKIQRIGAYDDIAT